ncbi:MAG: SDR family NAD(P)-dependent oxidoreductase [Rhodobacteraceae bacterium]|nr:SDR family NAD(P)-dependent oxidoreductase [Paracoccaceae bacterium]
MTQAEPRVWLITGADKGLGANMARTALMAGDRVFVTVLDKDGNHPLAADWPDTFRAMHLDARDHARFPEAVAKVVETFGRIDVLLNNAGYGMVSLAEETGPDRFRPLMEVNFFGTTEMIRAALPVMRKQRSGRIINISSTAGYGAVPSLTYYSASKYAVEGYSEALRAEVAHLGIKVTIIEPGPFRSDFAGPSLAGFNADLVAEYPDLAVWMKEYISTRHGTQPNDPEKFGPAVMRIVQADNPPLRLPLGVEAVENTRVENAKVEAELEAWKDVSYSTAYTAP